MESLIWPVHVCCAANTAGEHSAIIALYTNNFFMLSLLFVERTARSVGVVRGATT
jgi:hypothetical protein